MIRVRSAGQADAPALVALAEQVGGEEGRWILATETWRSVSDERRYLRSVERHPDADLGLMVAERYRRRGIGKMLLDEAVAWARASGISKLELHVFPWNEPAIALYESFGFEREGYRKRHYARAGEYVDAILMAYEVAGSE